MEGPTRKNFNECYCRHINLKNKIIQKLTQCLRKYVAVKVSMNGILEWNEEREGKKAEFQII